VALFSPHPLAREIARMGGRWHRTRAWVMGNGYLLSRAFLSEFVPWVIANEARARVTCEDALIGAFCVETARDVFHPLPSIVDHDVSVPSTNGADSTGHRRATVHWSHYMPAELEDPNYWVQPGATRLLAAGECSPRCWFCLAEDAFISSQETGVHIGPACMARMVVEAANRMRPVR